MEIDGGAKRKKSKKIEFDNLNVLTRSAIRRVAHKAGIKYFSESITEEIRKALQKFLEKILHLTTSYTVHARRTTVSQDDLLFALEKVHKKVYLTGEEGDIKRCEIHHIASKKKAKRGELSLRLVKYYQKQSDCVYFSRSGVGRLIREIADSVRSYGPSLHFTADAMGTLHILMEDYLVELLQDVQLAAIHAGRQKVTTSDLIFVQRIRDD
jgi:histone H3/H4